MRWHLVFSPCPFLIPLFFQVPGHNASAFKVFGYLFSMDEVSTED